MSFKAIIGMIAIFAILVGTVGAVNYDRVLGDDIQVTVRNFEDGVEVVSKATHALTYDTTPDGSQYINDSVTGEQVAVALINPSTEEDYNKLYSDFKTAVETRVDYLAYVYTYEDGDRMAFVSTDMTSEYPIAFVITPEVTIQLTYYKHNMNNVNNALYKALGAKYKYNMLGKSES